jgi:hypothetical protein
MMTDNDTLLDRTIRDLEDRFGRVFGMHAFPGERFSIHPGASFVSGGRVMIYTYRFDLERGWLAFTKGTPQECLSNFRRVYDADAVRPVAAP